MDTDATQILPEADYARAFVTIGHGHGSSADAAKNAPAEDEDHDTDMCTPPSSPVFKPMAAAPLPREEDEDMSGDTEPDDDDDEEQEGTPEELNCVASESPDVRLIHAALALDKHNRGIDAKELCSFLNHDDTRWRVAFHRLLYLGLVMVDPRTLWSDEPLRVHLTSFVPEHEK